jgi:hypothetical protein
MRQPRFFHFAILFVKASVGGCLAPRGIAPPRMSFHQATSNVWIPEHEDETAVVLDVVVGKRAAVLDTVLEVPAPKIEALLVRGDALLDDVFYCSFRNKNLAYRHIPVGARYSPLRTRDKTHVMMPSP